jgi:hypothetical protein
MKLHLDIAEFPSRERFQITCSCGALLAAETSGALLLAVRTHLLEHLGEDE